MNYFLVFVNSLMYCERKQYLDNIMIMLQNKANGFRKILKSGTNSGLQLINT